MTELRCGSHLHGILKDGLIEVKCRWKPCVENNAVVLHYFDPISGEMVKTEKYKNPLSVIQSRK